MATSPVRLPLEAEGHTTGQGPTGGPFVPPPSNDLIMIDLGIKFFIVLMQSLHGSHDLIRLPPADSPPPKKACIAVDEILR